MIYIIIRIAAGVIFLIFYKIAERLNCDPVKISMSFFASAFIIALLYAIFTKNFIFNYKAFIIGAVGGLSACCAVYSFLLLIKVGKFGLSSIITNLSFFIPVLVSILIYKEKPTLIIYISFILIILTFYLLTETSSDADIKKRIKVWIILAIIAMVASGIADTGPKLIEELNLSSIMFSYLSYMYFFALIPMLSICIKRKKYPDRKEWLIGLGLGSFSLLTMVFLVLSLKFIPGTVAYPLVLISVNIIVVIISFFIWKEKLKLKQIFGVCTGIIAAVLLNLHA
jgi:drug/metabolite transporter (DMT)-like permease